MSFYYYFETVLIISFTVTDLFGYTLKCTDVCVSCDLKA